MLDVRFRPITLWPRKETAGRISAPFVAPYTKTLDLLEYELGKLKARDIVIQADFAMADLSNDGQPRSGKFPRSPRVILSFEGSKGALSIPCDRFISWTDNIRAIALSLEALRKVDRYGITVSDEQYRGWAQLPAASGSSVSDMPWWSVLGCRRDATRSEVEARYRELAR